MGVRSNAADKSLCLVAACLLFACAAGSSHAGARPRLGLRVTIDTGKNALAGRLLADIENTTSAPLDHLELWRFPARLERRSAAIDEHDFYWTYPRSFDPGAMALSDVKVDGLPATFAYRDHPFAGPGTVVAIALAAPLAPGGHARIEAVFSTRIPRRYGTFGCYERRCTLSGGFYPMPVELGQDGYDQSAPPARADIDIRVDTDPAEDLPDVLIDGIRSRSAHLENAAWASLLVAPHFNERKSLHRGVAITYFHHGRGNPALFDGDRAAALLKDVREAIDLLHELHFELPEGTSINLVETALRTEIAEPQAGAVLVSDQVYRLPPVERFRKFHSFQLVRAVFGMLYERLLAGQEDSRDLAFSPDAGASFLLDRYIVRTFKKPEYAKDVLRWLAFVPSIDKILYAPQVPFAAAYFNTLDDPSPARDDLRRFSNERPRGKIIYEKIRDLLGDAGTERAMRLLWNGAPLRRATEEVAEKNLDAFFAQWMGPYPEVDYRFRVVRSEKREGGLRYFIRVFKDTPGETEIPVEPVELRVTEWGGAHHDLKWDGSGRETVLTVDTARSIRSIVLDPRGRLRERITARNDDLRLDNRSPTPVKFIYNSFGALVNLATGNLDLSLDFSLSRILDVKNSVRLAVIHNEAVLIGGLFSYTRNFGRMITPSRLTSGIGTTLRVSRLDSSFARAGEPPQPGTRFSIGLGAGYDNRFFVWEPWRYFAISASLTYALTLLDGGARAHQVTGAFDISRLVPITPGHGIAVALRLAATVGDLKVASQALQAGGFDGLRGYQPDELPGTAFALVRGEYRHVFVHDLNYDMAHIATLRGISGAVFTEAAVVAPCQGLLTSLRDNGTSGHDLVHNLFGDAGYSLRFLGDWMGVSQSQLNVEVAVPFTRRARSCFPAAEDKPPIAPSSRLPVGFYVYFGVPW